MNLDTGKTNPRQDWFTRSAEVIGDFASPFSQEERQRDVWNEASAFGLQLMLWIGLVAASVLVWTIGAGAVPYAVGIFVALGAVSWATIGYAQRLGVDPAEGTRMRSPRGRLYAALLIVFAAGVIRALAPEALGLHHGSPWWIAILVFAACAGFACAAIGTHRRRRYSST